MMQTGRADRKLSRRLGLQRIRPRQRRSGGMAVRADGPVQRNVKRQAGSPRVKGTKPGPSSGVRATGQGRDLGHLAIAGHAGRTEGRIRRRCVPLGDVERRLRPGLHFLLLPRILVAGGSRRIFVPCSLPEGGALADRPRPGARVKERLGRDGLDPGPPAAVSQRPDAWKRLRREAGVDGWAGWRWH